MNELGAAPGARVEEMADGLLSGRWGYAGLAALIGLAAGMVLAHWLEKWYSRAVRHPRGGQDE